MSDAANNCGRQLFRKKYFELKVFEDLKGKERYWTILRSLMNLVDFHDENILEILKIMNAKESIPTLLNLMKSSKDMEFLRQLDKTIESLSYE